HFTGSDTESTPEVDLFTKDNPLTSKPSEAYVSTLSVETLFDPAKLIYAERVTYPGSTYEGDKHYGPTETADRSLVDEKEYAAIVNKIGYDIEQEQVRR